MKKTKIPRPRSRCCGAPPWFIGSEPTTTLIFVTQNGYVDLGTLSQGYSIVDTDPAIDGDRSEDLPKSYKAIQGTPIDHKTLIDKLLLPPPPRQNEKFFHHNPSKEMKKLLFSFFLFVEKIFSIHSIVKRLYKDYRCEEK